MKNIWLGVWLGSVLLAGAGTMHAQDAKAAETFIREIYARYHTEKNFSPFADLSAVRAIATPALAALVKREQVLSSAAQDASALDADPLCGCQDDDGMQVSSVKVELTKPGQALVMVQLRFGGSERTKRRLFLLSVDGHWRIDNIDGAPGEDDVRKILKDSIALYTTKHKR